MLVLLYLTHTFLLLSLKSRIHVHPTQSVTPGQWAQVSLRNQLPAATGDNKYTEEMVPGYTGK